VKRVIYFGPKPWFNIQIQKGSRTFLKPKFLPQENNILRFFKENKIKLAKENSYDSHLPREFSRDKKDIGESLANSIMIW
jgi:hypothetical protein